MTASCGFPKLASALRENKDARRSGSRQAKDAFHSLFICTQYRFVNENWRGGEKFYTDSPRKVRVPHSPAFAGEYV
jgi:hypothetical protein